jgi:hypothetical protein
VVVVSAAPSSAEERLTVDQAVQLALKNNLRLRSAKEQAGVSHDQALIARAKLLPSVRLMDQYQRWNCAAALSPGSLSEGVKCRSDIESIPPAVPDLSTFSPAQQAQLASLAGGLSDSPAIVRKLNTNIFQATVDQPWWDWCTGLRPRGRAGEREGCGRRDPRGRGGPCAGRARDVPADVRGTRRGADRRRVVQGSPAGGRGRKGAAPGVGHHAGRPLAPRGGSGEQAAAADRGARGRGRAQGEAPRQARVSADGERRVRRAEAAPRCRRGAPPRPAPGNGAGGCAPTGGGPGEVRAAVRGRTRLARRWSWLLPEVDAQAAYIRFDGQIFLPPNQLYVGVSANWAIWEWGASAYQARAAARQAHAATLDLENERSAVAVEVHNARAQTEAAGAAVAVAQQSIGSAQEAYRVMRAQVKAGTATTTDLLDAQSSLTIARLNLARAQYQHAIERVALQRAIGE